MTTSARLATTLLAALLLAAPVAGAEQAAPAPVPQVQDLWWGGPQESGWGLSIVQHRDQLFVVLYVYDDTAHTTWYVVPGGTWDEGRTRFRGRAYSPHGTYFARYYPGIFDVGDPVGEVQIEFASNDRAVLDYTLRGIHERRSIVRQLFGPPAVAPRAGITDMWWGGMEQNGWGVAIMQQHATLFSIFFSYDRHGNPAWWVNPDGRWIDERTWEGRVYRPVGSRWLGSAFEASRIWAADAGPFRVTFQDDGHAVLEMTVLGEGVRLPLVRQPF